MNSSYNVSIDFTALAQEESASSDRFKEMARLARLAQPKADNDGWKVGPLGNVASQVFSAVAAQLEHWENQSMPIREARCCIRVDFNRSPEPERIVAYMATLQNLMNTCIGYAMVESDHQVSIRYEPIEVLN